MHMVISGGLIILTIQILKPCLPSLQVVQTILQMVREIEAWILTIIQITGMPVLV